LRARKGVVIAVCPIVGGKSLKGPSDKMLAELGHEPSAFGVAKLYADFTGTFVIDPADKNASRAHSQTRNEGRGRSDSDEDAQSKAQACPFAA